MHRPSRQAFLAFAAIVPLAVGPAAAQVAGCGVPEMQCQTNLQIAVTPPEGPLDGAAEVPIDIVYTTTPAPRTQPVQITSELLALPDWLTGTFDPESLEFPPPSPIAESYEWHGSVVLTLSPTGNAAVGAGTVTIRATAAATEFHGESVAEQAFEVDAPALTGPEIGLAPASGSDGDADDDSEDRDAPVPAWAVVLAFAAALGLVRSGRKPL
ncbi:MAG: hypothetical protein ACT4PT_13140 [Methanobacteriota archaeon]